MDRLIRRILIVGVGLIGGSFSLAVRRAGVCDEIVGLGRNESHLNEAISLGVIDRYETALEKALTDVDMILLCVPLQAMEDIIVSMAPILPEGVIVSGVGSAKQHIAQAVRQHWGAKSKQFVPGHPIAGTEQSGVGAAFAELFQGKKVILTPFPDNDAVTIATVRALWEAAGAQVTQMSSEQHDEVLALTSHLPHLLAFSLVDTLDRVQRRDEIFRYSAGGFRDFTRIASSDPVMWRDIFLANEQAVLQALAQYKQGLNCLEDLIKTGQSESLQALLLRAKTARDRYYARQERELGVQDKAKP